MENAVAAAPAVEGLGWLFMTVSVDPAEELLIISALDRL